jgi:hypothetical protein
MLSDPRFPSVPAWHRQIGFFYRNFYHIVSMKEAQE